MTIKGNIKQEETLATVKSSLTEFEKESIRRFLGLTDEVIAQVQEAASIGNAVHINMTIPQLCRGEKCVCSKMCYLWNNQQAPLNSRCPIEVALVNKLFNAYIESLQVDETNLVDVGLVRDLVDVEVRIRRTSAQYATDGKLDYSTMVGVDDNNNAIWEKKEMPHINQFNKLLREKERILKMLHATRAQKEEKKTKQLDPSTLAAKIIEAGKKQARVAKKLENTGENNG